MPITVTWRGEFDNAEVNALHAEAFETRVYDESEWNWKQLVERHSLGWVVARDDDELVGFVNVLWDGLVHAWIQDVMVAGRAAHQGIGTTMVGAARDAARDAGCEYLHVDFDDDLQPFYLDACGFTPTNGGLIALRQEALDGGGDPACWLDRVCDRCGALVDAAEPHQCRAAATPTDQRGVDDDGVNAGP
jgi:GNAT superfamily N-acetyltransferase